MNQASNTRNEPEANFYTPLFAKILYWILNFAIVVTGVYYAVVLFSAGKGVAGNGALLALLAVFGTLVSLVVNRIYYELLIILFEHLRATKEVRDLVSMEILTIGKCTAAVKDVGASIIGLMKTAQASQGEVEHPADEDQEVTITCPDCGKEFVLPENTGPGQHVRCPFCKHVFVIE